MNKNNSQKGVDFPFEVFLPKVTTSGSQILLRTVYLPQVILWAVHSLTRIYQK